jgi:arginyl-tRNA synthetase
VIIRGGVLFSMTVTFGVVEKTREKIRTLLAAALASAFSKGIFTEIDIPEYALEIPREKGHGDFAANIAMMLAKPLRSAPGKIAGVLVQEIQSAESFLERVEVAGPGFINFYLRRDWVHSELNLILEMKGSYGRSEIGRGEKIQVEFVSANPTGLLHMGNARGAALGDSLADLLAFAGYDISREYYINDAGNQIENFALSLEARYLQILGQPAQLPEEGYHGQDILETMKGFVSKYQDRYLQAPGSDRRQVMVEYALGEKIAEIRKTLEDFGVVYDLWFSEQTLHDSGSVQKVLDLLAQKGFLVEEEGAVWFKATELGLEKDEVLIRGNGMPTYFAVDIAYHLDKIREGFTKIINIWGADHHGHVARMKAALQALGCDPEILQVILMQLVRLYSGGEIVRMSKRTGNFVSLEELVEEVGRDAARYFFVMRSPDSHLDFDLDLAKSTSNDNPVYYIQYAHARISSVFRQLEELGGSLPVPGGADLSLLAEEQEILLIHKLADFPGEIVDSARDLAPHRVARYLHELAGEFHSFYNAHRIICDDPRLTGARLVLAAAVQIVLANGLGLLSLSAPEKM